MKEQTGEIDIRSAARPAEQFRAKLAGLSRNCLLILDQLGRDARADRFFRGYSGLAEATGIRRASVHDCMAELERRGLVRLHRNARDKLSHVEVVPLGIRIVVERKGPCAFMRGLPPYDDVSRETDRGWKDPEAAGL